MSNTDRSTRDPAPSVVAEPEANHQSTTRGLDTGPGTGNNPSSTGPYRPVHEERRPVPGYEVLDELGRGGMGVVYRAMQLRLNRPVALKVLLVADRANRNELIRFMAEAEAAASVTHPNVVRVYDFGESDGRPYMAMEYLPGGTLGERLKSTGSLAPREAATVVRDVAAGVAAAHAQGIVHRDLKPGNVLLDADGELKVSDFGLAKRQASEELTHVGAVMGTPNYMAPEQAKGDSKFVGPQADVWALGIILYECLTGKRPFEEGPAHGICDRVIGETPKRPSQRVQGVPRDLETVCLKCLEKSPADRYQTAAELTADLELFMAGRPINARPAGAIERALKWARRKPAQAAVVATGMLAAGLLVFGSAIAVLYHREQVARGSAESERTKAVVAQGEAENAREGESALRKEIAYRDYLQTINLASRALAAADYAETRRRLDDCAPEFHSSWEWKFLDRSVRSLQANAVGPSRPVFFNQDPDDGLKFQLSPDGRSLLAGNSYQVFLFDASTGQVSAELTDGKPWGGLILSRALLSANGSQAYVWHYPRGTVIAKGAESAMRELWVWNIKDGKVGIKTTTPLNDLLDVCGRRIIRMAPHPDCKHILVAGEKDADGKGAAGTKLIVAKVSLADGKVVHGELPYQLCFDFAFSPTGEFAAIVCGATNSPFFQSPTGFNSIPNQGPLNSQPPVSGGFNPFPIQRQPNFRPPVYGPYTVHVVDLRTGAECFQLPESKPAKTGNNDRFLMSWDPTGSRLAVLRQKVYAPNESRIANDPLPAGLPQALRGGAAPATEPIAIWDARSGKKLQELSAPGTEYTALAYFRDGMLATGAADGRIRIWDLESRALVRMFRGHAKPVSAVAPGESHLASLDEGSTRIWDLKVPPTFQSAPLADQADSKNYIRTGGPFQAIGGENPRVIRTATGEAIPLKKNGIGVRLTGFTSDYRLVFGDEYGDAKKQRRLWFTVWDSATGQRVYSYHSTEAGINQGAVSPDGIRAALLPAGEMPITIINDLPSEPVERKLELPESDRILTPDVKIDGKEPEKSWNHAESVEFGPNGRWLAATYFDGSIRVWDLDIGKISCVVFRPTGEYGKYASARFMSNGLLAVRGNYDPWLRFHDPATGQVVKSALDRVPSNAFGEFTSDGRLYLTTVERERRLYDVRTGAEILNFATLGYSDARLDPDGSLFVDEGYGKHPLMYNAEPIDRFPLSASSKNRIP